MAASAVVLYLGIASGRRSAVRSIEAIALQCECRERPHWCDQRRHGPDAGINKASVPGTSYRRTHDRYNRYVVPGLIDARPHWLAATVAAGARQRCDDVRSAGVSNFVDRMRELVKGFVAGPDVIAAGYHVRPGIAPEFFLDFPELGDLMSGGVSTPMRFDVPCAQPVQRR
jgi:hypothetical protein